MKELTISRLKELLSYDPLTGHFTRLETISGGKANAGDIAGHSAYQGYIGIGIDGRYYKAHRVAWFYMHGVWPTVIDHKNRIKSDNRLCNLREVTVSQNRENMIGYKNNKSGHKGVYHFQDAWVAQINSGGKRHYLGRFKEKEDAIHAYKIAASTMHTCNPLAS